MPAAKKKTPPPKNAALAALDRNTKPTKPKRPKPAISIATKEGIGRVRVDLDALDREDRERPIPFRLAEKAPAAKLAEKAARDAAAPRQPTRTPEQIADRATLDLLTEYGRTRIRVRQARALGAHDQRSESYAAGLSDAIEAITLERAARGADVEDDDR